MGTERGTDYRGLETLGWLTGIGSERVCCRVQNISQQGANLVLLQAGQPTDYFRLYFSQYATTFRMCKVQARKEDVVSVRFVGGTQREIVQQSVLRRTW
jgi:hypothetical protein